MLPPADCQTSSQLCLVQCRTAAWHVKSGQPGYQLCTKTVPPTAACAQQVVLPAQGLMELGAMQCTANTVPDCPSCPLAHHCGAWAAVQRHQQQEGVDAQEAPSVLQYPSKVQHCRARRGPRRSLSARTVHGTKSRSARSQDLASRRPGRWAAAAGRQSEAPRGARCSVCFGATLHPGRV